MAEAPAFDPSKPFEAVEAPAFDPSRSFEDVSEHRNPFVSAITDVPHEVYEAGKSALSGIAKNLNPFSEERNAEYRRIAHAPSFMSALTDQGDLARTGKGLMGIAELPAAPVTGAARSLIGHPLATVLPGPAGQTDEQAYESAKDAVDTAMMGLGARGRVPAGRIQPPTPPTRGPFGVTLSEGQATGDLGAIQREQRALRGQSGDAAQRLAQEFSDQQAGQLKSAKDRIAESFDQFGQQVVGTPQAAGDIVSQSMQTAAKQRKAGVTAAYNAAKSYPGDINASVFENMGEDIKKGLSNRRKPIIIDDKLTPFASKAIQDVDDRISQLIIQNKASPFGQPPRESIAGINLAGIDQMRKRLSAFRQQAFGSGNRTDGMAAKAVIDAFDDRIDAAVNSGLFTGDKIAINAWNAARAAHADYRSTFSAAKNDPVGRVVEHILGKGKAEPAIANDVADFLYGATGVNPNSLNVGVTKRVRDILGDRSPEWSAVKQGIFRRIVEPGADLDWGPKKVADKINKFLNVDGRELSQLIFTPDERSTLQEFANLQRQLEVPQSGAYWSNNATWAVDMFRRMGSGIAIAVGSYLGHATGMPLGVGEGTGYAIAKASQSMADRLQARAIAKQLPIITQQVKKYQKALAVANRATTSAGGSALAVASSNLARSLDKLGISFPALQAPGIGNAGENQEQVPRPPGQQKDGGRVTEQNGFAHGGAVKSTKAKVHYRTGSAKKECQLCTMFIAPRGCTAVQGYIAPKGLCDLFERKELSHGGKPKINRSHDVPYLAGASNDGKTVYIDRRVPRWIMVKRVDGKGRVKIDPAEPLAIHEQSEHAAMVNGKPYEAAHIDDGTADERAWVEQRGLDWKHYEAVMDGLLSHIEHENPERPPLDLYERPYPHSKQVILKRAASKEMA